MSSLYEYLYPAAVIIIMGKNEQAQQIKNNAVVSKKFILIEKLIFIRTLQVKL